MTKAGYFELCDTLGNEPVDSEIPIEISDLPELVQLVFSMYETLPDEWEYMGGNYVGKKLINLEMLYDLYEIPREERLLVYKIISQIDSVRKDLIRKKEAAK